jgi:hypothetical protein
MGAREYDPASGLFLSADPAAAPGTGYGFGNANPMAYVDPLGLWGIDWRQVVNTVSTGVAVVAGAVAIGCTVAVICAPAVPIAAGISLAAGAVSFATDDSTVACVSGKGSCASTIAQAAMAVLPGGVGALGRIGKAAKSADKIADTVLYQKLSAADEHLKYGITKNPATRYTAEELNGGRLNILARGSKQDMLALERSLHETLPIGPEEGQTFYIQKQIANGLRPPPYTW